MANEITRLLPFRQYDDNDVVNFYSYDLETGEAGSVVKVSAANLNQEPVEYVERTDANSYDNTLGNALSLYPETPYKVTKVSDTGAGVRPLGIMLRDVRSKDENGENLLYYPEKKDELQCYAVLFSPIRQGDGDELGAVIHAQFGGIASPGDDAFQYPNDPRGREVQINLYGQDLPVKVVHHVERPEASATE